MYIFRGSNSVQIDLLGLPITYSKKKKQQQKQKTDCTQKNPFHPIES